MTTFLNMNSVKLNKWQVALLLGTPLAIGLGMYVLNSRSTRDEAERGKTQSKDGAKERQKGKLEKQTLSIDGTAPDSELERKKKSAELVGEKMSPLKEANNYKTEGNNCYRNGKYDEAISFYDKAIDKCPLEHRVDLSIFYQNRAASYEMLKKWHKVKEDCTLSLQFNPRYAKAYYRRARAHEATKEMIECLDDVTATCILEMFQNNNTIMFADRVLKETGRLDAEKGLRERLPVVPSASFINTYMRSFIADPLQTMPVPATAEDSPPRGFVRARLAFDEQKYDEIIAACTEEIESSEAESQYKVEALLMRGTFHLLCGSFADSKLDFDAILANGDAETTLRVYAHIKRAALYIQTEDREKGLADFAEAEKLMPDNPDVYHQRAQILLLLEQIDAALLEFERTVRLAPHHAIANVQKCYAEYRLSLMSGDQKRLGRVIHDFEQAIEKFPDCVECYSLMAQVLADQQQFPQAQQFYEMAMKRAPTNPALLVHQAIMMLQWRGDIESAVTLLNRAIEVDPKCELAYETLGTVEVQRAQLQRAVELFEKALLYAKSQAELVHVYSLRNAALAQINVTRKLGIDMNSVSNMAQSGFLSQPAM